jgi:Tfp pilus assembly protein PilO
MAASGRLIGSILVLVALAIAFWMLILSPKREESDQLGQEIQQLTSSVESARSELVTATTAKRSFPADYRQLIVLGQAAPAGDETASLLVELEAIARSAGVSFDNIQLSTSGEEAAAAPAPAPVTPPAETSAGTTGAVQAAATVPPTELEASLLPLGASIGPAGLDVMPYSLEFSGSFFEITNFVQKIDSLVRPGGQGIEVDGRLITISAFNLSTEEEGEGGEGGGSELTANLTVTTYLSPPSQGVTAGATSSAPAASGGEPSFAAPVEAAESTSETVSAK